MGPSAAEHAHQAVSFSPGWGLALEPCLFNQSCHPWKYIFELRKQRLKNIWVSFFLTGEVWKDHLFLFLGFQHWFLRKYCSAHPSVLRGPNTQSINVFFLTQSCFCCSQSGDSNSYRDCECSMCKGRSTGKLFELWHLDTCLQRCLPRNPNESW